VGNVELHSVLKTYPFKADGNGDVRGTIFLPNDLDLGTHTLRICWNGACRAQVTLHVVAGGQAQVSPGATPLSGANPLPGSSPSPKPVGGSSPTPSPTPIASPKLTPSPSPSPTASITLDSISLINGVTITFHYFHVGGATVRVWQNAKPFGPSSINVASNSASWNGTAKTPTGVLVTNAVLGIGPAYVVVCTNNGTGPCYTSTKVPVSA